MKSKLCVGKFSKLVGFRNLNGLFAWFILGIVLAIGFDRIDSLDELWSLHRKHKLRPLMHDILITPAVLKSISCKTVTLDVKLWDDEYEDCRKDLLTKLTKPENILSKGRRR